MSSSSYTTSSQVTAIIEVDPSIDLDVFIATAHELVAEFCEDKGYTDSRLELIERYLSAHFYTLRDPRPVSEKAGEVSVTYQSKVALRLSTSHYGQTAMLLDTAGGLTTLNEGKANTNASLLWLGTEASETQ